MYHAKAEAPALFFELYGIFLMRFLTIIILSIVTLVVGQACTERMICPAYQSAFIHDKDALKRQFSYFNEDSTPKVFEASKDRFLIIEPVSYHRKLRSLQTIAMTDIYPELEEDSLDMEDDQFYLAERDVIDSTQLNQDSTYMISLKRERFNTEQELYLWYLKDYLVYPDVRLLQEQSLEAAQEIEPEEEKVGFFKRLFGKKKKKDEETEFDVETNATDIDDNIDEANAPPKEKKGLFGRKKKKNSEEENLEDPVKEKKRKKKKDKEEEEQEESVDPASEL